MTQVFRLPSINSGHMVTDNVVGADYVDNKSKHVRDMRQRYEHTPVFDPNIVPRGGRAHIGQGVWIARCHECDNYALSWGSQTYIWQLAHHEATHGIDVPGYNTPIL